MMKIFHELTFKSRDRTFHVRALDVTLEGIPAGAACRNSRRTGAAEWVQNSVPSKAEHSDQSLRKIRRERRRMPVSQAGAPNVIPVRPLPSVHFVLLKHGKRLLQHGC